MAEWTDEMRAKVVADYVAAKPTGENTIELIEAIAKDIGKTVNGVRMILNKNDVYVKVTPAAAPTKAAGSRVSKQDAIDSLTATMKAMGITVDESILSKLTGKAAMYFTEAFKTADGDE